MMDREIWRRQFDVDGYAIIPRSVSISIIDGFRNELGHKSFWGDGVGLEIKSSIGLTSVEELLFSGDIIESLQSVLGNRLAMFPNITVRVDTQSPWHIDEAFRQPAATGDRTDVCDFVQAMIYFQENGSSGGGLDVIPGSHRLADAAIALGSVHNVIKTLMERKITIHSQPGDCVVWDKRLLHRSTPMVQAASRKNYGLQWTVASQGADKARFLKHLLERGRNEKDKIGVDRRYNAMADFYFDGQAPQQFMAKARHWGVELFDSKLLAKQITSADCW